MAYVSILLPAFHFNTTNKSDILKALITQFETTADSFELFDLNTTDHMNIAVKFKQTNLSLSTIDDLIYQRNCIKSTCEKSFESLQVLHHKLCDVEREFKVYTTKTEETNLNSLIDNNNKLKEGLAAKINEADKFRKNTEATLKKIKDQFYKIGLELEGLRTKVTKSKGDNQSDNSSMTENNISTNLKKKTELKGDDSNSNTNSNSNQANAIPHLNFNK